MDKQKFLDKQRQRRRFRIRKRVRGEAGQPRLCIHRTLKNISCQLIDDSTGKTLASASTQEKDLRGSIGYGGNCDAAAKIGKLIAERAKAAGVETARFDRGHCKFHGRVKALADAARESGLQF